MLYLAAWERENTEPVVLCEPTVAIKRSQLNWKGHTVSAGPPTSLIQIYSSLKNKWESIQKEHMSTNAAQIYFFFTFIKDKYGSLLKYTK